MSEKKVIKKNPAGGDKFPPSPMHNRVNAGIQKKLHGCGAATLIISNEEINDIMKIVQVLEDSNILLRGVTKTTKNETKGQKGGF